MRLFQRSLTQGLFPWSRLTRLALDEFRLGFIWEISARFPRWGKAKDSGDEYWCQIRETKQTWRNTQILTFGPIIASVTLKSALLQLNGKIHQAMQDEFIPPFIWQNFQPDEWNFQNLWKRVSVNQLDLSAKNQLNESGTSCYGLQCPMKAAKKGNLHNYVTTSKVSKRVFLRQHDYFS